MECARWRRTAASCRPLDEIVQALFATRELILRVLEDDVDGIEVAVLLPRPQQLISARAMQTSDQPIYTLLHAILRRGHEFGCGGRCWCADVGGCIGDGGVRRVANAGNYRNGAGRERACEGFVVEAMQLFPASAATRGDDNIRALWVRGEPADAGSHGRAALCAPCTTAG